MESLEPNKYFQLRQQLTALNYPTTFGADAVDLVQRLLNDLVSTTDSGTASQSGVGVDRGLEE